jgi:hypothetical protein
MQNDAEKGGQTSTTSAGLTNNTEENATGTPKGKQTSTTSAGISSEDGDEQP